MSTASVQGAWRWLGDHAQAILAADFFLAGVGTILLREQTISKCLVGGDAALSPGSHGRKLTEFVTGCFGAQATLCGLTIGSQGSVPFGEPSAGVKSKGVSSRFFACFALAMIPFFCLNAYATIRRPLVRETAMLLDALNNVGVVVVCKAGYDRAHEIDGQ